MVDSKLVTLNDVIDEEYFFNIPIYQRLYVWGKEQVQALLSDIWGACKDDKDVFYLGGTLVIERPTEDKCSTHRVFDLIDGQQRFTTLWLIAIAWQDELTDYRFEETNTGYRHRIEFAIRPQVKQFFQAEFTGDAVNFSETGRLQDALKEIRDFPNNRKQEGDEVDLHKLTRFIREKVQLVFTQVPEKTDLNKLFEVINNRGVQLQHHEILKARLLGKLDTDDRGYYGQIWDACSYMNDYVEKNLRDASGLKIIELFDQQLSKTDEEPLLDAKKVIKALKRLRLHGEESPLALSEILESEESFKQKSEVERADDYESDRVRSIISFPMLLQHTLRIFLAENERDDINKILDKDLITIFERHWLSDSINPEEIKQFIAMLWEIRYLFDKHIIKWVEVDEGEVHSIRRLRINTSGAGRKKYKTLMRETTDAEPTFGLLQSMLYHSQQMTTHYWLTPLLSYLLYEDSKSASLYLKYLDNHLLCAFDEQPLIERTRWFLEDFWYSDKELDVTDALSDNLGTDFAHYWFYKLEYILWEQKREKMGSSWRAFRMTAKNSVEHISPQNPEKFDSNTVSKSMLNSFGNLSLVSRSINSEYSNKPYSEKRARFKEKNRAVADSLKMSLIYQNEKWNVTLAVDHQDEMLGCFEDYFSKVEKDTRRFRVDI
jgi:hypothetical protein